jgi:hypothetical protein
MGRNPGITPTSSSIFPRTLISLSIFQCYEQDQHDPKAVNRPVWPCIA